MNYPQVVLGGVPIFTQADENRYPDGVVCDFVISSSFIAGAGIRSFPKSNFWQ